MSLSSMFSRGLRRLRAVMPLRPTFVPLGDHAVGRTWRGDRIFLSGRDLGITPYIATTGRWEPPVERLLDRLLRPGHVVVECGANVGYHTLGMGHAVGPAGHVHSFEANPELSRLLELTVQMAGFNDRVTLYTAAVTDQAGTARLLVDPLNAASGHLAWEHAHPRYSRTHEVPAMKLDDALATLPRIDLLRMDIEGAEGLALRGAEALLRRSPGVRVLMEWDPAQMYVRSDVPTVAAWIASEGFRAEELGRDGRLHPVSVEALSGLGMTNLLLTRST